MDKKILEQFIQESIKRGEEIPTIQKQLLDAGWDEQIIQETIKELSEKINRVVSPKRQHGVSVLLAIVGVLVIVLGLSTTYLWYERIDLSKTNEQKVRNFYAALSEARIGFTDSGEMIFPDEQKFISEKEEYIARKESFVEVNLKEMNIVLYEEGNVIADVPVLTKGKEGSWWETPTGSYEVLSTFTNKFSSIGNVWMPYSIQVYGNYFIHGWPYYSDGSPVAQGYSGGCIRLSDEDAKTVFDFVNNGMKVLVLEEEDSDNVGSLIPNIQNVTLSGTSARTIQVADISSGKVLLEKDSQEQFVSRATTATMTAIVAHEIVYLARPVIAGSPLVEDALFVPEEGESYIGMDLLYPLLMQASLNAETMLASFVGKGLFVQNMNNKASSLGMDNTIFSIEESGEIIGETTADDIKKLLKYVYYKRPFLLEISKGTIVDSVGFISVGDSIRLEDLNNENELWDNAMVVGQIQGSDPDGTESSMSVVEIQNETGLVPVSIIVSGSGDGANDTKTILNWIQQNYR